MTALEELEAAPDGVFYNRAAVMAYISRALEEAREGDRLLSPGRAARELGWSKSQWTRWAPRIAGSFRDEAGRWRLPRSACRAHVAAIAKKGNPRKEAFRGPQRWRSQTSSAARAGSAHRATG